jgi:hypothetical protein
MGRHEGSRKTTPEESASHSSTTVMVDRFGHVMAPGFHEICGLRFHEELAVVGNHPHSINQIGAVEPLIEPRRR